MNNPFIHSVRFRPWGSVFSRVSFACLRGFAYGIALTGLCLAPAAQAQNVNWIQEVGASTGNTPAIYARGSDASVGLNLIPKGAGVVNISGTLAVTANSTTSVVNLSTAGVTWGYLASAASYLPNLSSNVISATAFIGDGSGLTGIAGDNLGNHTATQALIGTVGTAALPGYTFSGDTNTGMYWAGADQLGFTTAGIERMRILANGRVGIGTTAPIGGLHVLGDGGSSDDVAFEANSDTFANYSAELSLYRSRGTASAKTAILSGDLLGMLRFIGHNGSSYATGATISSYAEGNYDTAGTRSSYMNFFTTNAGSHAERMRIAANGNVGIGTTAPNAKLDVAGTVSATNFVGNGSGLTNITASPGDRLVSGSALLRLSDNSLDLTDTNNATLNVTGGSTYNAVLQLGAGRTGNGYAYIDLVGDPTYSDYGLRLLRDTAGENSQSWLQQRGTGAFNFVTQEAAPFHFFTNSAFAMGIASSGNVGIGTISPTTKLQVDGGDVAFTNNKAAGNGPFLDLTNTSGATPNTFGPGVRINNSVSGKHGYVLTQMQNAESYFTISKPTTPWTSYLAIDQSGNVGIGTTAPNAKLDVAGTVSATSFVGNGAGLTNVTASSGDRLVSGSALLRLSDNSLDFTDTSHAMLNVTGGAASDSVLQLGAGRTSNSYAYIDLVGDPTYSDYGLRLIRGNGGANTHSSLNHRGMGPLYVWTEDAAPIYFYTSSTFAMGIAPSGAVGIGTASPLSAGGYGWLTINGSSGGILSQSSNNSEIFRLQSVAGQAAYINVITSSTPLLFKTNDTERMRIASDGNVGIGTTNPTDKLQVEGGNVAFKGSWATGNGPFLDLTNTSGATPNGFGPGIRINNSVSGKHGYVLSHMQNAESYFTISNLSSPYNSYLAIDQSGNVGIGTTAPGTPLDVNGHVTVGTRLKGRYTYGSDYFWIGLDGSLGDAGGIAIGIEGAAAGTGLVKAVHFSTNGYQRVIIDQSGNVGIGTTAPIAKLHLVGGNNSWSDGILLTQSGTSGRTYSLASREGGRFTIGDESAGTHRFTINSSGNIGIGTVDPTTKLHVVGDVTAAAYYQSSDRRLKTDIQTVGDPFALLNGIEGRHFRWKSSGKAAYGVIAQEVARVMPEAVGGTTSGTQTVDYAQMVAPLIEAVKQLDKRVKALEAENRSLKAASKGH